MRIIPPVKIGSLVAKGARSPATAEEEEEGRGGGWEGEKGWAKEGLPCNPPLECFICHAIRH